MATECLPWEQLEPTGRAGAARQAWVELRLLAARAPLEEEAGP